MDTVVVKNFSNGIGWDTIISILTSIGLVSVTLYSVCVNKKSVNKQIRENAKSQWLDNVRNATGNTVLAYNTWHSSIDKYNATFASVKNELQKTQTSNGDPTADLNRKQEEIKFNQKELLKNLNYLRLLFINKEKGQINNLSNELEKNMAHVKRFELGSDNYKTTFNEFINSIMPKIENLIKEEHSGILGEDK